MKKQVNYAGIRGFNYTQPDSRDDRDFWLHYSHETVDRDMGYAERLRLNSARIFLSYSAYRDDPDSFFAHVRDFVRSGVRKPYRREGRGAENFHFTAAIFAAVLVLALTRTL